jgi:hypothetical protein
VTRSDRLKAALCALVDDRREEIDAIRDMHGVEITVTFDDAGCIEYEVLHYEIKRHKRRQPNIRSQVA